MTAICWFRQDLRLEDNPALYAAAQEGSLLLIYILDDENAKQYAMGGASRFWLHHSLDSLQKRLEGRLNLYAGNPRQIIEALISKFDVKKIFWNRCYEPWRIERDSHLKTLFQDLGLEACSFNGTLLWEPWQVLKSDRTPYQIFTHYYRKGCLSAEPPKMPLPQVKLPHLIKDEESCSLDQLHLLPSVPWHKKLEEHWEISEEGAKKAMQSFLKEGLNGYKKGRDYPHQKNVSKLSPYLHFGQLSIHTLWSNLDRVHNALEEDIDHFRSELAWREFSYYLLYHRPFLPERNLQVKFDRFPWKKDEEMLKKWQKGMTGYPIVDAGMRQLWQTGYIHNRVRMVCASFLVKNLMIDWKEGMNWFWDTLVDADLANNSASWQWVAGSGADAAPYFRIFNPITQGSKFDPEGEYTLHYVPQLRSLPLKYLFCPWEAPENVLRSCGIELGKDYPLPIVDVKQSREKALEAFSQL